MNKIVAIGGAGVAVAAAIVGGAAYTGQRMQRASEAGLASLQGGLLPLKVIEDHYDRELFSATHTVTLSLGCPAPAAGADAATGAKAAVPGAGGLSANSIKLTVRERIQHGPLPGFAHIGAASIETELVTDSPPGTLVWGSEKQPPLTAHTLVGLTGGYSSHIVLAPGHVAGPTGARMEWQAAAIDLKANNTDATGPLRYELESPGTQLRVIDDKNTMRLQFGAIKVSGDLDAGSPRWLRTGKTHSELASLEITTAPGAKPGPRGTLAALDVKLSKLAFTDETTRDKQDLVAATSSWSGEGAVGTTKIDKFELRASVKRLHAPGYAALIQHAMASPCDESTHAGSPAARVAQLQKDALQLLPHNLEFALEKFSLDVAGKHAEGSYTVGLEGVTADDLKKPLAALVTKVNANGKVKLPRDWLASALGSSGLLLGGAQGDPALRNEMTNMMLEQATTNGFVVVEGDMLSSSFALAQGRMLVNGKPIGGAPAAE